MNHDWVHRLSKWCFCRRCGMLFEFFNGESCGGVPL